MPFKYNPFSGRFDYYIDAVPSFDPDLINLFDTADPNTPGTNFTDIDGNPTAGGDTNLLYVSSIDSGQWTYDGANYNADSTIIPSTTPFYLLGTTIDAGGNKTAPIHHLGLLRATKFTGDGLNITGLNASNLSTGTVNVNRLGLSGTRNASTYLAGDNTWKTLPTTTIDISNTVYIDSLVGSNSTGDGSISNPYQTVDYVLTNYTVKGTFSCNTNTSVTLTGVSDIANANLKIGQFVTGTGIPFGTTITALGNEGGDANTVTLSQAATSTGAITGTWWSPAMLHVSGNQTATSNWWKQGFFFAENPSVVVDYGAFVLYNINETPVIPYYNNSKFHYNGLTSTSEFYRHQTVVTPKDFVFLLRFSSVLTQTTGTIFKHGTSTYTDGTFLIEGHSAKAPFGRVATSGWMNQNMNAVFNVDYSYGLLAGVNFSDFNNNGRIEWNGTIETPTSVLALNMANGALYSGKKITGQVTYVGPGGNNSCYPILNCFIIGGTINLTNCSFYGSAVSGTVNLNGNVDFYGHYATYLQVLAGNNRVYRSGQFGINVSGSAILEINQDIKGIQYGITLSGTSKCFINSYLDLGGYGITVGGGCYLETNGELKGYVANSGTWQHNGVLNVYPLTVENGLNSGSVTRLNGKTIGSNLDGTKALYRKDDSSRLDINPGSEFIVLNGKSPIRCPSNTPGSKDIYLYWAKTNCDGATYGLLFPFDGASYAPNDLVGGTLYENINY